MAQLISQKEMVKKCLSLLGEPESNLDLWWPHGKNGVRVRLKNTKVTYILVYDYGGWSVAPYKEWLKKKGAKK